MQMKIQGEPLEDPAGRQASQASEAGRVASSGGHQLIKADLGAIDPVSLSHFSGCVAQVNQEAEASDAKKVSALASLYNSGRYEIDSARLSRALVDHSLTIDGDAV